MDNDEYQLLYFLGNIKKYLSNLCDNCIDDICDSTLQNILVSKLEPNKKIEAYIKLIKEKRNKIDCDYRNTLEEMSDSKDNIAKNLIRSESDNNSHLSDCDGNCTKSTSLIDINNNKNYKMENTNNLSNKLEVVNPNKKNKGNKKKKKKSST
jgi:hypothetical protein